MRLFVAIALPPEAASELDEVVAPVRPSWPELRWTGVDAWHLTLAFLGEVDEVVTSRLAHRMHNAARRHTPLSLSLAGAGAFPGAERARVLWTGIQGDLGGLRRLADSVAAGARKAGAPPADGRRGYQPHLTLARCRAPADVSSLVDRLGSFAGTPWVANEIYLIHSRLGAHPRYEVLGSWPLRTRGRGSDQRGGHSRGASGPGGGERGSGNWGADKRSGGNRGAEDRTRAP
jgi:RNA 2',3'-cyclic 3'-phosphodiesterase